MKGTHSNKIIQNKAFTYYIKDYNAISRIYTLENPITKEVKTVPKSEFEAIYGKQIAVNK